MAELGSASVRITAGGVQAGIDSVRAEAYAAGHRDGQLEILTELERARAFTTMQARRTLWRIRQRLDAPATLDTP